MSVMVGRAERDEGMEEALKARLEWQQAFKDTADRLKPGKFTSEHITDIIGLPSGGTGQHRNNAVGAMMAGLAKRKVIRRTGHHVQSSHSSSHAAELTEWTAYENEVVPEAWRKETIESAQTQRDHVIKYLAKIRADVSRIHAPQGKTPRYCKSCKVVYPCRTIVALRGKS